MHPPSKPRKKERSLLTISLLIILAALLALVILLSTDESGLVINEIMASNRIVIHDEDGAYHDWIELFNSSSRTINLEGYWLANDPDQAMQWVFPETEIGAGEYLLIYASGNDRRDPDGAYFHTNFRLARSGDQLTLGHPDGTILDEIVFEDKLPSNISLGRISPHDEEWVFYLDATPGAANDTEPYEQVLDMPPLEEDLPVFINEFLVRNRTSLADEDGDLYEWIEFYNSGEEAVNLKGFWLSDKESNPYKWRFPEVIIEPEQFLLVFASGKNRRDPLGPYLHTGFGLNDRDDELVFKTPDGKVVDLVPIREQFSDVSYGRDPNNAAEWLYFPQPTPLEPNYTMGYETLAADLPVEEGVLFINEVMSENLKTITDEDGDYKDWIELYNSGDLPVNLKGFGLSDNSDNLFRWTLPDVTIGPGDYLLVFASRKDRLDPDAAYLHTNYQIQVTGETISLTHPSGQVIDQLHTGRLGPDISIGRNPDSGSNRYLFTDPTPGKPNTTEPHEGYAFTPLVSKTGGFYDGPITVALEAPSPEAEIRYTLDGREPTSEFSRYDKPLMVTDTAELRPPAYVEGELYTGPFEISETTVLRARAYEEGRLPSVTVNRTFYIGEEHNLPVLSVMGDPDDFFDPVTGIYERGRGGSSTFPYRGANFWQSIELPVHLELYEPDGRLGFSFDMGLRIAGQYSRAEPQKSFNLFARNIYGYNEFKYPFFPDFYPEKPLANKAITLRTSGQDWRHSKIRDIMMTSLLEGTGLDYQAHRQSVLYINGEYWGIYNIRERINEHFLAYNHGLDPDKIDLLQGSGWVRSGSNEHYYEMLNYARANDLSDPRHYEYIKTQMDIINYIDYWVAQIYFAQIDSANIRFWREQSPEGRWRWITFDLDWAIWGDNYSHNTLRFVTSPAGTGSGRSLNTDLMVNLLRNDHFRQAFVERLAYHLNNTFAAERVLDRIDTLAENIEPEMTRHLERWGGSMNHWTGHLGIMRTFAERRHSYLLGYIRDYFSLTSEEMQIFDAWE